MDNNVVILAAAGSRKTEHIVNSALGVTNGQVLITTYINENQRQIINRIEQKNGFVPANITVMGWFTFLIRHCAKPYQRAITNAPFLISGLNFKGSRNRYVLKSDVAYFIDRNGEIYRDGVSDFVTMLNNKTGGAVISRLERVFTHVFVDEVQDLVGYDLEVLDLLFASRITLMLVGDPRQHTLATNIGPKNKKYRGVRLMEWFEERSSNCMVEERTDSYRCNQSICDFADAIFPNLPPTKSVGVTQTNHDGIFQICITDIEKYLATYDSVKLLRYDKTSDTKGLEAINIGVSKGSTYDRVMIFPTKPMLQYLVARDSNKLKAPEKLYVAVTRARFSVAFVVRSPLSIPLPLYEPNQR